jgi:hypothetical protein
MNRPGGCGYIRRMRSAAVLLLTGLLLGCAGRGSGTNHQAPVRDAYDGAYLTLRAQADGCPPATDVKRCCGTLKQRLDDALAGDRMAEAAVALDALAISCPKFRGDALAALGHLPRARPGGDGGGSVTISYVVDLGPGDRLYWLGAHVDGGQSLRVSLAPGVHQVEVEAHVMTTSDVASDQLYTLRGGKLVNVVPGQDASVLVVLKRASKLAVEMPFVMLFPDRWAPAEPGTAVELNSPADREKVQLLALGSLRYPSELRAPGTQTLATVCVNSSGRVFKVTPIHSPHPRHTASVVSGLFRAQYKPYQHNGQAVPFCYLPPISFN